MRGHGSGVKKTVPDTSTLEELQATTEPYVAVPVDSPLMRLLVDGFRRLHPDAAHLDDESIMSILQSSYGPDEPS